MHCGWHCGEGAKGCQDFSAMCTWPGGAVGVMSSDKVIITWGEVKGDWLVRGCLWGSGQALPGAAGQRWQEVAGWGPPGSRYLRQPNH